MILLLLFTLAIVVSADDPYAFFRNKVMENGYHFESYEVVTEDGYILALFRIKLNSSVENGTSVAYLNHGLADDADIWI